MSLRPWIPVLAACSLLLPGCDDTPQEPRGNPDPSDDLFAAPRLVALAFEISATELNVMLSASHAYGRATVREGDASFSDVGIRYKGRPTAEAASGKPDFKVRFDEFGPSPGFHGYQTLLLLACRGDPSYLSAPIGLELFREAGVPAARSSFARVQLNGSDLGLYVIVEGEDRQFIRRHFVRADGNLYDEGEDADITGELEKSGGVRGQPDVDALAVAALQVDAAQRWQQLEQILDVERFIVYAALEVLLWMDDSYSIKAEKFRLYHDPSTDRMVFFPKNVEEVLDKTDGPLVPEWGGLVARGLLTTPQGRQRYRATLARLLQSEFRPEKVHARARELSALIGPSVAGGDAGASYEAAVAQFMDAVAKRAAFAAEQLKTLPE